MKIDDKDSVWAECGKLGEPAVRAMLEAGLFSAAHLPRQWLLEKAEERRLKKESEDRERTDRALEAAEASAAASGKAAQAARRSAFWTMWAAIFALLSVLVQAGWMEKVILFFADKEAKLMTRSYRLLAKGVSPWTICCVPSTISLRRMTVHFSALHAMQKNSYGQWCDLSKGKLR